MLKGYSWGLGDHSMNLSIIDHFKKMKYVTLAGEQKKVHVESASIN